MEDSDGGGKSAASRYRTLLAGCIILVTAEGGWKARVVRGIEGCEAGVNDVNGVDDRAVRDDHLAGAPETRPYVEA